MAVEIMEAGMDLLLDRDLRQGLGRIHLDRDLHLLDLGHTRRDRGLDHTHPDLSGLIIISLQL